MLVILEGNWFVGGRRIRKGPGQTPVEIPDELYDQLPKSAKVVEPPAGLDAPELDFEEDESPEDPEDEDPATMATRILKETAHANDGVPLEDAKPEVDPVAAAASALAKPKPRGRPRKAPAK